MMKVIIAGYGRMGRLIEQTLLEAGDEVVGRIDTAELAALIKDKEVISAEGLDPLMSLACEASASKLVDADIIMDFSNPSLTDKLIAFANKTGVPLLSGTTNMTAAQHEAFAKLGEKQPAIWASNYSLGVNLFMHILPQVAGVLEDWDIEITETHHNKKIDAPSGTAKSLADAIDPSGALKRVYGRSGNCGERTKKEISSAMMKYLKLLTKPEVARFSLMAQLPQHASS